MRDHSAHDPRCRAGLELDVVLLRLDELQFGLQCAHAYGPWHTLSLDKVQHPLALENRLIQATAVGFHLNSAILCT